MISGRFFEDLDVGEKFSTLGRTVTETDIVQFLNLSRVLEPQFSDREFYENEWTFGGLVVPGALTFAIAMGLFTHLDLLSGTALAFLGMDEFRLPNPLICRDTLHVDVEILSKRLTSRQGRGIVTAGMVGSNQTKKTVISWKHTFLIACKQ